MFLAIVALVAVEPQRPFGVVPLTMSLFLDFFLILVLVCAFVFSEDFSS